MAFRDFDSDLSRRALLRGGGYLAAGAAAAGVPFGAAAFAQGAAGPMAWPATRKLIDGYVASGKVANIVSTLGFGRADPTILSSGNLGYGSSVSANADSLYRIYSMTKPITGMAAMMLIDDGLIGLDQPVAEILPAFADMRVLRTPTSPLTDTVPADRPVTMRNLLTHTAGLGYDIISKGPILDAYRRNGILGGQVSLMPIPGQPNYPPAPGLEAFADRVAKLPLIYQPGTKWSYSIGLDIMGRVIEVASRQPFNQFLQSRIFDPCGMDSTYFAVPRSERGRLTDNSFIIAGAPLPIDPAAASVYSEQPPIYWGGSGLVSSPRDYDRFLEMLLGYGVLDGKRVMGELAVRVGTGNILPDGASTEGSFAGGKGYGAGGRSVNGTYGWGGAAGTAASVDFTNKLRGTMFTQYMPSDTYPLTEEFLKAVMTDVAAMKG